MVKKIMFAISMIALMGIVALNGIQTSDIFAQKNGWGKATSEEAQEDGAAFGKHASDPDNDGVKGNNNQESDGDNQHRSGIGNVPEKFTGSKNPSDLGKLLDNLDCDDPDDIC